jgi:hypothetical protein
MPAAPGHDEWYDDDESQSAIDQVQALFETQLAVAQEEQTRPNEAVHGDAVARRAFWEQLSPKEQREFFMRVLLRHSSYWPRLRSLVGAPPYSFLLPGDRDVLNAGGIARSRTHMAHEHASTTSANCFFRSHFEDSFGRLYRIVSRKKDAAASPMEVVDAGETLAVDVRLPNTSGENRRRPAPLPMRGAAFSLRRTRSAQTTPADGEELVVRVKQIQVPPAAGKRHSPVVRLALHVEQAFAGSQAAHAARAQTDADGGDGGDGNGAAPGAFDIDMGNRFEGLTDGLV